MYDYLRTPLRALLLVALTFGLAAAWVMAPAGAGSVAQARPVSQTAPIATTVDLVTSPNPSTEGGRFTMTATVSPASGTDVPTGTVTFYDGTDPFVAAQVGPGGPAVVTTAQLSQGSHSLTAQYSGDDNFDPSTSSVVAQEVNTALPSVEPTTTTLTSAPNPAAYGQVVTYTATVASAGLPGTPTGSVTFYRDNEGLPTWIATADIMGGAGEATLELADLAAGTHSVTAEYTGDPSFLASQSSAIDQTIDPAATTTVLASSQNPVLVGQPVEFSATVSMTIGSVVPQGAVTFFDNFTGIPRALGTVDLDGTGVARLPALTHLLMGTHTITAEYSGDANAQASVSQALAQQVAPPPPASQDPEIQIVVSPSAPTTSDYISVTARVIGNQASGAPTGRVQISCTGGLVASSDLAADGPTSGLATFALGRRATGEHVVEVSYFGDGNYRQATSASTFVVGLTPSRTSLTSDANPAESGEGVSFTATVESAYGHVSGTVGFYDGTTLLGEASIAGGLATLTTRALAGGTHTLTARYGGDANNGPSASADLSQRIDTLNPWAGPQSQPPGGVYATQGGQPISSTQEQNTWTGQLQVAGPTWFVSFQSLPPGFTNPTDGGFQPLAQNVLLTSPGSILSAFGYGFDSQQSVNMCHIGPYGTSGSGCGFGYFSYKAASVVRPGQVGAAATGSVTAQFKVPYDYEPGDYTIQFRAVTAAGDPVAVFVGIRVAPAVEAKATSTAHRSKLKVSVKPTCKSGYQLRVERLVTTRTGGSDEPVTTKSWKWRSGTHRIKAGKHSVTMNLPAGTYRAVVAPACGKAGTTTGRAKLKR